MKAAFWGTKSEWPEVLLLVGCRGERIKQLWEGKGRETRKRCRRCCGFGTAGVRVVVKAESRYCRQILGSGLDDCQDSEVEH